MTQSAQYRFVKSDFSTLLAGLTIDQQPVWGKMNAIQMVEHLTNFFEVSTGKIQFAISTPEELLPKAKAFLYSDKVFRENTKAPVLPDEPAPERHNSLEDAVIDFEQEKNRFFELFENGALQTSSHPVFGVLNFEEWILLHHKHLMHHGRQFQML